MTDREMQTSLEHFFRRYQLRQIVVCVNGTHIKFKNHKKTRKNAVVEYLDYLIPVTQLKGQKGNGDMKAAKRD